MEEALHLSILLILPELIRQIKCGEIIGELLSYLLQVRPLGKSRRIALLNSIDTLIELGIIAIALQIMIQVVLGFCRIDCRLDRFFEQGCVNRILRVGRAAKLQYKQYRKAENSKSESHLAKAPEHYHLIVLRTL
jgi:hypothetical protein